MSSLGERIQTLVKGPQFAWWVGHVVLLICTLFYLPYWLTFRYSAGAHWYTRAFLGAILSYGVVVYKSFPINEGDNTIALWEAKTSQSQNHVQEPPPTANLL